MSITSSLLDTPLKRSVVLPHSLKPRSVHRKNNSTTQSYHHSSTSQKDLTALCQAKDYDLMDGSAVRKQNRQLKSALVSLNSKLNYHVQRRKVRLDTVASTQVSIREIMDFVPKDMEEELRRNTETICALRSQLSKEMDRRGAIQDIEYRVHLDQKTAEIHDLIKDLQGQMKVLNRSQIFKDKEIKAQEKFNKGQDLFRLRRQLIRAERHVQEAQQRIVRTQNQNEDMVEKIQIVIEKQRMLSREYNSSTRYTEECEESRNRMQQNNCVYLECLNRIKAEKRRINTCGEIGKVKYYTALKRLDLESERQQKISHMIAQIQDKVRVTKQTAQRFASKIQNTRGDCLGSQEQDTEGEGFLITQVEARRNKKLTTLPELSRSMVSSCSLQDQEGESHYTGTLTKH